MLQPLPVFLKLEKLVADFHQEEGHKYVKEYELIKVKDGKSHLKLQVTDHDGFGDATSTTERRECDKANIQEYTVYSLKLIE